MAIADGQYRDPATNRIKRFNTGERFWVANSCTNQATRGAVEVCRMNQSMGTGLLISADALGSWFAVEDVQSRKTEDMKRIERARKNEI